MDSSLRESSSFENFGNCYQLLTLSLQISLCLLIKEADDYLELTIVAIRFE